MLFHLILRAEPSNLIVIFNILVFFLYVPFFAYAGTEIDFSDPIAKYQDIIIAAFSVVVGSLVATLLVQYWNNKKETNEKRRTVLNNYFNEVKKPSSLMDTFIDKLLIYLSSLDKTNRLSNGKKLSENLTWTYSFKDLEYFKDEVPLFKTYASFILGKNTNYTKDDIF
jgi:Cu/Ag efflux pump CusA